MAAVASTFVLLILFSSSWKGSSLFQENDENYVFEFKSHLVHACHKLWNEMCEINPNFKGDLVTFRISVRFSQITKKLILL